MSLPIRFTVCTYNIWTHTRWPERRPALQSFARHHLPDILCLQEVQAESRAALDEVLSVTHARVEDPFEGWTCEGNIYWNTALFEGVEYGAEDVGILEPYRRMFWVRLRLKDGSGRTILVATAHWTWAGHPVSIESEKNIRIPQARATMAALARLAQPDEPQLFMGDLNDNTLPIAIVEAEGYQNCFAGLGRSPDFTHPAAPTAKGWPVTIDWIFHKGALRPMTAEVVDFFEGDMAPSDHKPVLATYALISA